MRLFPQSYFLLLSSSPQVIVNPELEFIGMCVPAIKLESCITGARAGEEKTLFYEGCLSVPGYQGIRIHAALQKQPLRVFVTIVIVIIITSLLCSLLIVLCVHSGGGAVSERACPRHG